MASAALQVTTHNIGRAARDLNRADLLRMLGLEFDREVVGDFEKLHPGDAVCKIDIAHSKLECSVSKSRRTGRMLHGSVISPVGAQDSGGKMFFDGIDRTEHGLRALRVASCGHCQMTTGSTS